MSKSFVHTLRKHYWNVKELMLKSSVHTHTNKRILIWQKGNVEEFRSHANKALLKC
jgi:hypothetical protein